MLNSTWNCRMSSRLQHIGILFCLFLLLASCGSSDSGFQLQGRFRNLDQGEFYIYDAEKGWKDTITVRDGRFSYQTGLKDTTILTLVFPNFSELPIFAQSGVQAAIEGDASQLRKVEVKGSEANEEMTAFRLRTNQLTPPEALAAAEEFIGDHPDSPVSFYLLKHYFIQSSPPDYLKAARFCRRLLDASPENGVLVRLQKQLSMLAATAVDSLLPHFAATDMNGRKVSDSLLRSPVNVVLAWASWNAESRGMLRKLNSMKKKHPGKIAVVSICLDANSHDSRETFRRDSITWPNICTGDMWHTPLMQTMGLATVPAITVADKQGKILERNLPNVQELEDKLGKLLSEE